jgi:hypothetical protein
MKYVVERKSRLLSIENGKPLGNVKVYLEDKRSKNIPKLTPILKNAEILTENEAYEWFGRLKSQFPEDNSITIVKINPKTMKLDYTELY